MTTLLVADRYAIASAIPLIVAAIKKFATLEDACRYIDLPESVRSQEALKELMQFSRVLVSKEMSDLDKAYQSGKFEKLTCRGLFYALVNVRARIVCEHTVFVMVWKWVQADERRVKHFPGLSRLVRYHQMTSSFLVAIQQLPECAEPRVAASIRRALLFRGVRKQGKGVLLAEKAFKEPFEAAFKPRAGSASLLQLALEGDVFQSALQSLELGGSLLVDTKEAFGYTFSCSLRKLETKLGLLVSYTLPFPEIAKENVSIIMQGRFRIGNIVDEEDQGPFECTPQGEASPLVLHFPWDGDDRKSLHPSHFGDGKLRISASLTLI